MMREVHFGAVGAGISGQCLLDVVSPFGLDGLECEVRGPVVAMMKRAETHSSELLETISAPRTSTRSCVPAGDGSCESSIRLDFAAV